MAGVTVDSVIVQLEARITKYQADLDTATKKTEAAFAKMRRAATAPITPKIAPAQEATAVEQVETKKRASRKKTVDAAVKDEGRLAAVVQRAVDRDNARTASAERNAARRGAAYNKELAKAQTRVMSGTALGSGTVAPAQNTGRGVDATAIKQIELENRLTTAKAAGAVKTTRALQDQIEKLKLIEKYQRAGLNATDAKARAEQRLTAIVTARAKKEEAAARAGAERSLRQNRGGIAGALPAAATGIIGAVGIAEISALNDKYIEFTNRLKLAGLEGQAQKEVQDQLFASAQRYGVELGSLGGIFQKATEAGREYGATQAQNVQFTNAVAAAVKVQGGSVESARGAILQLGQSLQSGTVRAEEFNSMMEGLFPLLQAAAQSSDKYGGSVAKLRAAAVDGKLSSEEFFNLILKGSNILEQKATQATLTTAAGFTTLTNALTVYFGEADKSNGVSAALGEALGALGRNLDIVVPALAAVAIGLGVYKTAVAIATAETTIFGAALTLLERHPVILALSAVAAAVAYFALTSDNAAESTRNLTAQQGALQKVLDASKTDAMTGATNGLSGARSKLTAETIKLAKAEAYLRAQQAEKQLNLAKAGLREVTTVNRGRTITTTEALDTSAKRGGSEASNALRAANAAFIAAGKAVNSVRAAEAQIGKGGATGSGAGAAGETAKEKRTRLAAERKAAAAARKAENAAIRADREQARDESQDRQAQVEVLRARAALTDNVEARADFELQILALEKAQRLADIQNDRTLSEAERAARLKYIETLYGPVNTDPNAISVGAGGLLQKGLNRDTQRETDRIADDIASRMNDVRKEELRDTLDMATTREERARIQTELLQIELQERKRALERERKETDDQGKKDAIQSQIDALPAVGQRGAASIARDNEGPLAQYTRGLSATSVNDQVEQYVVDELNAVQSGIAGALQKAIGTDDPLISGLLNIFIQDVIMKPLAEALSSASSGGGGIGGILSSIGAIFAGGTPTGRASGGNVVAGSVYRVNEDGVEGFRPAQSGTIIPLGRMNQRQSGGTTVINAPQFNLRGAVVTTELYADMQRISNQSATRAGGAAYAASQQSAPGTISKYSQLKG